MIEKYLQFDTEIEALEESHSALVRAGEYRPTAITYYLCEVRKAMDGFWYMIIPDDSAFNKYKDKGLPDVVGKTPIFDTPVWDIEEAS